MQKEGDGKRVLVCLVNLCLLCHVELHSQSAGLAVLTEEESERWRRRKRKERRFAQHSEEQRSLSSTFTSPLLLLPLSGFRHLSNTSNPTGQIQ